MLSGAAQTATLFGSSNSSKRQQLPKVNLIFHFPDAGKSKKGNFSFFKLMAAGFGVGSRQSGVAVSFVGFLFGNCLGTNLMPTAN